MSVSLLLLHASIASLVAAAATGFAAARRESRGALAAARVLAFAGTLLALGVLVRRGQEIDGFPLVSRFDTLVLAGALMAGLGLAIDLVRGLPILTVGAAPLALVSLVFAALVGPPAGPPQSALLTPTVGLHVLLTLASYAAFGVAFVASILFLIEQRQLKARAGPSVLGLMPSLETSYGLTRGALVVGLAFLTAGVLLGYQYGRTAPPAPNWRWDPKIVLTTGAWAAYLVVVALSLVPSLKGRRTALASAICFVLVMATSWIASFWSGFHRYP